MGQSTPPMAESPHNCQFNVIPTVRFAGSGFPFFRMGQHRLHIWTMVLVPLPFCWTAMRLFPVPKEPLMWQTEELMEEDTGPDEDNCSSVSPATYAHLSGLGCSCWAGFGPYRWWSDEALFFCGQTSQIWQERPLHWLKPLHTTAKDIWRQLVKFTVNPSSAPTTIVVTLRHRWWWLWHSGLWSPVSLGPKHLV